MLEPAWPAYHLTGKCSGHLLVSSVSCTASDPQSKGTSIISMLARHVDYMGKY